jgi:hypothetical protein
MGYSDCHFHPRIPGYLFLLLLNVNYYQNQPAHHRRLSLQTLEQQQD